MQCILHAIIASTMNLPTSTEVLASLYNADDSIPLFGWLSPKQSKSTIACRSVTNLKPETCGLLSMNGPLVLKSVMPQWNAKKCY